MKNFPFSYLQREQKPQVTVTFFITILLQNRNKISAFYYAISLYIAHYIPTYILHTIIL